MIRPILIASGSLALACGGALALALTSGTSDRIGADVDPLVPALAPIPTPTSTTKAADETPVPNTAVTRSEIAETALPQRALRVPEEAIIQAEKASLGTAPEASIRPLQRPNRPAQIAVQDAPALLPPHEPQRLDVGPTTFSTREGPAAIGLTRPTEIWATGVYR